MDIRELRIGNWLQRLDDTYFKVTATDILNLSSWKQEYLKPNPIELTEEVLLKCGFKKWGRDDMKRTISYELGDLHIFPSNNCCDFEGYGFMWYKPNPNENIESAKFKMKHLHQLQNLVWCLSGKELDINL